MARIRKLQPTLESTFFATPEQKVLRFLLSEPTTSFTPRVISSKLKGVRGLGGIEGIGKLLLELEAIGMIEFVDNRRSVRAMDENPVVLLLKSLTALCDLEGLKTLVMPVSERGILFGSRASGRFRSDSDYDLFVVSENPGEVRKIAERHPLGKLLEIVVWTPDEYADINAKDPGLQAKLARGIPLWGSTW